MLVRYANRHLEGKDGNIYDMLKSSPIKQQHLEKTGPCSMSEMQRDYFQTSFYGLNCVPVKSIC